MSRRRRELALVFALVFGAVGGASRVAATNVPFTTRPAISNGADFALFVYAADIDGDGDLDGLSASINDDKIAWYENVEGDGSSWVEDVVSTVADGANSVFAADVDGDGDMDILSSSAIDDAVAWYENLNGDGSAWGATTISSTADSAGSVFAGDIDGDGDTDVVSASNGDDKIAWYENENGSGTSWTPRTIAIGTSATGADGAIRVFAADIDGDGDLDVASASFADDKIAWHENTDGIGTAWTTRNVFTTADNVRAVVAADIDGDGDADLLSVAVTDDLVLWHENLNGIGTSWSTATLTSLADQASGVFAADVDGDGDIDALSASRNDDEVAWYENVAGDGSSWTRRLLSTLADRAYSVFAGDVDGDGDVDVLSASAYGDEIAWYENRTIHRSALLGDQVDISTNSFAVSVFAADVDGDGDMDAVRAEGVDSKITWSENEAGDGTSWTTQTIADTADLATSVFAADVDGDGDVDVLSASFNDDEIAWYENASSAGDGTSWAARTIATTADGAMSVFAVDVNGDGDLDVLSASFNDDEIASYENASSSGDGTSWTARTIATDADQAQSVLAADVDGDGDMDVLSASRNDDEIAWHENAASSGNGTTWISHVIATTSNGPRSVFAADVDGDGDVDALSASEFDHEIAWYENESGNGTSWTVRIISTIAELPRSVFAADLDGDGDVDALSAASVGDDVSWYENASSSGDGTSWIAHNISTTANAARSVFAADVDGDGDMDALSAAELDQTVAWYPNRGGQFALPTTALAQGILANSQEEEVLRIDLEHRGRAGDSDVELDTIELLLEDGFGTPLTSVQADNLIAKLELFLDEGSGSFESPGDALVELVDSFTLVAGVQSVSLAGGGPDVEAAFGESKRYFVVVTMTPGASSVTPDSFEVVHLTEASSTARDASVTTVPLRLEHHPDTTTGLVDTNLSSASCKAPFELDLQNLVVTSALLCEAGTTIRGNGLLVASGFGALTLRAGQRVRLVSDLTVSVGGTFSIEIDPSLEP